MPDFVKKGQSDLSRLYRANSQIIVTAVGRCYPIGPQNKRGPSHLPKKSASGD
jgi:hypothetical protein